MEEKISLIVCTYNRLDKFKILIRSIKNQTMLPDELIISDDGSQEDIEKLLREEFKNEKKIKVKLIKQKDLGFRVARARNNGARESKGEILIFIDSDIIIQPKFIEIFYRKRKKRVLNLSRSIRLTEENTKKLTPERIEENNFKGLYTYKDYLFLLNRYYKNIFYSFFFKKKLAKKFRSMAFSLYKEDYMEINGFDENFIGWGPEDVDFGLRAFYLGISIKNSHKNNFQFHQWHKESDKNNGKSMKYFEELWEKRKKSGKIEIEYGYKNTYGNDRYEVIKIC